MSNRRALFPTLMFTILLVAAGPSRAQTDAVSLKSTDTSTQIPRLVVTTSTGVGALASVRVEQSRFYPGTNAIFQLGTYTPGTPGAGDVRYSGGNVLYYDSSAWQTLMQLGPNSPQASSSANPCIYLNETNAGAPSLLTLQVAGASRFTIANSGSFTAYGDGLPSGNNSLDLGSSAVAWNDAFVGGTISFGTTATRTTLNYTAPSAGRTITFPNASGNVLLDSTAAGNFVSSVTGSNGITPTSASTGGVTLGLSTTAGDTTSYVMNQTAGVQTASFRISGTGDLSGTTATYQLQSVNSNAGAGTHAGLYGQANGAGTGWNIGVYGNTNNSSTENWGVLGDSSGTNGGKGVYGRYVGTGSGQGVGAANNSTSTGTNYAISGQANGNTGTGTKYGVYGETLGTATSNYGVSGNAMGAGTTNYGIYGTASGGTTNWAGYFNGNVNITGSFTVAGTTDPYVNETGDTMTGDLAITGAVVDFNDVVGEKVMLYGASGGATSYALGIEGSTLYARANGYHRWYVSVVADSGASESMELDSDSLNLASKEAIGYGDSWLRLNNASSFGSGTYTPGLMRADGGFNVDNQTVIDNDGGWHRSYGATGWYNGTYGGGWYMTDAAWVRTYSNSDVLINDTGDAILRIQGPLNSDTNIARLEFNEDVGGGICGLHFIYLASSERLDLNADCGSLLNIMSFERSSQQVGIGNQAPAYDLHLGANSAAKPTSSSWTVPSDRLLKTDIFDFEDGLDVVRRIHPVWYRYNGLAGMPTEEMGVGVIAQELREVMPYAVKTWTAKISPSDAEETELLAVDDYSMNYVMINALQELDEKDGRILHRLQVLEEENRLLRQMLEQFLSSSGQDRAPRDPRGEGAH